MKYFQCKNCTTIRPVADNIVIVICPVCLNHMVCISDPITIVA